MDMFSDLFLPGFLQWAGRCESRVTITLQAH